MKLHLDKLSIKEKNIPSYWKNSNTHVFTKHTNYIY